MWILIIAIISLLGSHSSAAEVKVKLPSKVQTITVDKCNQKPTIFNLEFGKRYKHVFKAKRETHWYKFTLKNTSVMFLNGLDSNEQIATFHIFDSDGKVLQSPGSEQQSIKGPLFNEDLTKGTYYIRLNCEKTNGEPYKIEICYFENNE